MPKTFLFVCFFIVNIVFSQQEQPKDSLQYDVNQSITPISLENNWKDAYTNNEYSYESLQGEGENLLGRLLLAISNFFEKTFGIKIDPTTSKILQDIFIFIMAILAIYLILKHVLAADLQNILSSKKEDFAMVDLSQTNIENIDLDSMSSEAYYNGNYRLAIRFEFLKLLQHLSQNSLINWEYHKTNQDYLAETQSTDIHDNFQTAVYTYEWIWYGDHPIEENIYHQTSRLFSQIKS
ncbi:MAG: hypothetical protein OIF50_13675 [Flavobacteriaceae bacterium]|nr:hypothetical protein [Flavobacteriaceae bacterium]